MKDWINVIFVLSIISFVSRMLLPNKRVDALLTFLLSVMSIIYIISPIKNLIKGEFAVGSVDFSYEYSQREDEFEEFRSQYYLGIVNNQLAKQKIQIKKAQFSFDDKINGKPLKKITINYDDIVINDQTEHINISLTVKKRLCEIFSLTEDAIIIYEF